MATAKGTRLAQPLWRVLPSSLTSKINLRMTLCGGQCFHWHPTPRRTFVGAIGEEVFEVREVFCPRKAAYVEARRSHQSPSESETTPSLLLKKATDVSEEVCCWVEYRKLWPMEARNTVVAQQRAPLSQSLGETALLSSSSGSHSPKVLRTNSDDEALLSWYLSLDVDLAALWVRWTDTPATRDHRLVTYLIGNSADASLTKTKRQQRATSSTICEHDGGGGGGGVSKASNALYIPIRHVRQDVHSCLFSFLCSQNNHVTRITSMIYALCRQYGSHLCDVEMSTGEVRPPAVASPSAAATSNGRSEGKQSSQQGSTSKQRVAKTSSRAKKGVPQQHAESHFSEELIDDSRWMCVYSFPSIEQLSAATDEKLRSLGFGYRSKYVVQAVKSIATFALTPGKARQRLHNIPPLLCRQHATCLHNAFYADLVSHYGDLAYQREKLESLSGVGRKVADCVLLFSLSHSNLVPVDTHMAQVAVEYLTSPSAAAETQPPQRTFRKRSRSQDSGEGEVKASGSLSWEQELLLWGEKSKQMRAEAVAKAQKGKKKHTATNTTKKSPAKRLKAKRESEEAKLPVPPLYERHHDAIQCGFTELFGTYAGWAHSILFYYRMRK